MQRDADVGGAKEVRTRTLPRADFSIMNDPALVPWLAADACYRSASKKR